LSKVQLHNLLKLSKEEKKVIKRHVSYSGAINVRWLSEELNLDQSQMVEILKSLGYHAISDDWYMSAKLYSAYEIDRNDVFHHAIRKLSLYCGPLPIEDICGGVRHAVYKTDYPVPPPYLMGKILQEYGYSYEEDLYFWNGPANENLSDAESIIITCIKENGPVVHHSELAQDFINSSLSFPALHATLSRSPLFDRIGNGLYKLRGRTVTENDILRAESVAEHIPVNLEVKYDKTGKITILATLGILATGTGVITSDQLPNLSGEWGYSIGQEQLGKIQLYVNEIRHLLKVIKQLQCKLGDRLSFTFDTWTRNVNIEKVG